MPEMNAANMSCYWKQPRIRQGNRKTEEGDDHPDRDAQFRHINRAVKRALRAGEPVISVDTKKKELIGNYQNQGRQWRKAGTARSRMKRLPT